MTANKFLTVSIPAYNDEKSLIDLVDSTVKHLDGLKFDYDIFIVNDGSTDATHVSIQQLKNKYQNVHYLKHDVNYGFGKTLSEVFSLPQSEWVLFLPGDHQFPITNIDRFLLLKDTFDFIIGFRKSRKDNLRRKAYSFIYNKLVSYACGYDVHDVNSIVFFKTELIKNITLDSKSAFIHAELFIKALNNGARVIEVDIVHNKRKFGFGAGGNLKVIAATGIDLFRYFWRNF
jgi:dolichol-phosphate mannosyltransferase